MGEENSNVNNIDYNDFSVENAKKIIDSFKIGDVNSLELFLDYIENYYRANKNVNIFKNSNIFINIVDDIGGKYKVVKNYGLNSNYVKMIEILKNFTSKPYFTELFNPLNSKTIDICSFQKMIDIIYECTGIYLQNKYSKIYNQLRNSIREDVRKLCLKNKSLIESLPIEEQERFSLENSNFYLGKTKLKHDSPYKEIMENSKYIKVYIDLTISELFKTSPNVVYFDIISMLRINNQLHFLSDEDANLYSYIISTVCSNDIDKVQEMADKLESINIVEKFYDDMLKARRSSAAGIIKDLYKPNDDDLYHDEKYPDAVIYDLRDPSKKFSMIIRGLGRPFDENYIGRMRFLCCSLRNNNKTKQHWGTFVYGYNIDEDDIIWQSEHDHYTEKTNSELTSKFRSILVPSGRFLLDEINIVNEATVENGKTKYIQRKPSFIVAYDEITDEVYNESKRLNIPIYLVRTLDESKKSDYFMSDEVEDEEEYVPLELLYSYSESRVSSEELGGMSR